MLKLVNIAVSFEALSEPLLEGVSFSLERGEIGCLLGPSGCGKTTLLRAIAGFHQPSDGEIIIDDISVSSAARSKPVNQRNIGMVFQDFALFPHMTVSQNIGFGLSSLSPQERLERVHECLKLVGLESHSHAHPHQLSGGQQQRVALARAIAPKPSIILMDEPFSSLDLELREQLATDIRSLLKQINTTAILVTHDQNEAFAMADKIAVMNEGKLHQWGTAYELYHQPTTVFVAQFIGESVFLKAEKAEQNILRTAIGDFDAGEAYFGESASIGNEQFFSLLIRPDDIEHSDDSPFKARIISRVFRGSHILYTLNIEQDTALKPQRLLCLAPSHHDHKVGEQFGISLQLEHMIVFPFSGGSSEVSSL